MKSRTLLIDGDILLYRFGFRHQHKVDWGDGVVSEWCDEFEEAKKSFIEFVSNLNKQLRANRFFICLTGDVIFRYDLLPSYKHNRKGVSKPELYLKLKEYVLETYPIKCYPNLEADDCLGILGTYPGLSSEQIICTIDKDLKQIPGLHFNWDKDTEIRTVTEHEADYWFYTQTLTGDSTDGYSGCPTCGAVGAKNILAAVPVTETWHEDVWDSIVRAYAKRRLPESYAVLQARIARILRHSDFDFKTKQPILWLPVSWQSKH